MTEPILSRRGQQAVRRGRRRQRGFVQSRPARLPGSSVPTAPARRRCSISSPAFCDRKRRDPFRRLALRRPATTRWPRPAWCVPDPAGADPHDGAGEHDAGRHGAAGRGAGSGLLRRAALARREREIREQARELLDWSASACQVTTPVRSPAVSASYWSSAVP